MADRIRIGDMLVQAGFVTEDQVLAALTSQRETKRRLGDELVEMGVVTEVQLTQILSNQLSVPWVSLYHVQFSRELLNLVPAKVAESFRLIPVYVRKVRREGDTLFIAMDDPTREDALDAVRELTGMPVKPMVAPPSEIQNAIRVYYFGRSPKRTAPAPKRQATRHPPPPEDFAGDVTVPLASPPTATDSEAPEVTVEETSAEHAAIIERVAQQEALPAQPEPEPEPADEFVAAKPEKKKSAGKSRMITLTLLDGTTVRLPAPGSGGGTAEAEEDEQDEQDDGPHGLTASDLVSALMARSQGADVSDILPDDHWEPLFATLLTLLIRKGLIADWEFVEEWVQRRG